MAPRNSGHDLPPPTFELESWSANYEGPLLPYRLLHIALHCKALSKQALTLAVGYAKQGKDVQLYNRLTDVAGSLGISELAKQDTAWASRKDEENRREQTRLESELRGYKNNLIRESIRMGQEDLATHLLLTGGPIPDPTNPQSLNSSGYNAAFQQFGKMRDYCTTPTHINAMNLRLVYTAILQTVSAQLQGNSATMHLQSLSVNGSRLRSSGVKEEEQSKLTPLMRVSFGIASLGQGHYTDAAKSFLATPFEYHNLGPVQNIDFERSVANANDVAIYGGLCALATMSRDDLVENVLGGPFRAFLELEPHMRKAIGLYTTAKYQACITTLQRYYSDWNLDIFLGARSPNTTGSHVDNLFARIRERSITAYFSSFSEVSLASLASTFPPLSTAPDAMEVEVLNMIENGTLNARLDVVNGVLIAPQKEMRSATHLAAKTAAEEVERTLLLRLHKVNMTLAGLEIPKTKGSWDAVRGNGY
ncbi:COP9 signalosome complex subunit 1 [Pseudocercospora fuligena]|uniref:COP9 signalosome complex subunit 1 n=1 Tax=Pseudocercospora fuligena TaxID=685502 RepID=A0A8H6RJT4_9PEZI|nr:COP9 signalosome complex subunit 1 [Pseudocercospora fuligena]